MATSMIVITGPTASGKTSRAVDVAHAVNGEVISADSRQIYCGMDLGTGKDLDEYGDIPYHMIDICPAGYRYNLFEFCAMKQLSGMILYHGGKCRCCVEVQDCMWNLY